MKKSRSTKSKVILGAATLAALMASGGAKAATDDLTMTARIIAAIKLTATQNLTFGSATAGAGGTIKVDQAGTRTAGGGVSLVGAGGNEGSLKVAAANGVPLEISMPNKATLTQKTGTKKMTVKSFLINSAPASTAVPFKATLGAATAKYKVGGTLYVGAAQATGKYVGKVLVTANYQ